MVKFSSANVNWTIINEAYRILTEHGQSAYSANIHDVYSFGSYPVFVTTSEPVLWECCGWLGSSVMNSTQDFSSPPGPGPFVLPVCWHLWSSHHRLCYGSPCAVNGLLVFVFRCRHHAHKAKKQINGEVLCVDPHMCIRCLKLDEERKTSLL